MENNRYDREERTHREYDNDFMEETAAEVLPLPEQERGYENNTNRDRDFEEGSDEQNEGRGVGYFALALSVLSLFFLPVLLGAAGIIVGFFARRRGASTTGNWAIGLGIASIVVSLIFVPFF
ncbi:DUF4190 domain-containing protein [Pseudalkalibacillus berkeleyi]|uniref:DUF4190 domain-containing protein n=1 Tax=Pseudalkalibacillus berkeleyi TaxID=1069813 RepID=A0ABS9H2B4_9BACL|nr:DUF4190 domain-containing protein [Pseudalkalibacillus berkeleyi]MCF6137933.1 DUF4190 domain-containing protein [Pseudalkalibacillus berkeleyi]